VCILISAVKTFLLICHSFIHSLHPFFLLSFIYCFVCLFVYLFTYSLTLSLTRSLTYLFNNYLFIYLYLSVSLSVIKLICLFVHLFVCFYARELCCFKLEIISSWNNLELSYSLYGQAPSAIS